MASPLRWLRFSGTLLISWLALVQTLTQQSAFCDHNKIGAATIINQPPATITSTTTITPSTQRALKREDNNKVSNVDSGRNDGHCNDETEFICQSDNNRCIPIEWRCDFTEQCSDGEDEFGCLPEWCDFDQGLCNWNGSFASRTSNGQAFWRRYLDAGVPALAAAKLRLASASSATKKKTSQVLSGDHKLIDSAATNNLQIKLSELRSKLDKQTKFLFAPLIISAASQHPMDGSSDGKAQTTSSAHLRAPLISQTNNMCQIRFKYAMWMGPFDDGHSRNQLTLSLLLAKHNSRTSAAGTPQSSGQQLARVVWSKTIEQATPSSDWFIEVVELGHLKGVKLEFEAKFTSFPNVGSKTSEIKPESAANDLLIALANHEGSSEPLKQQPPPTPRNRSLSSFVALNWLKFQGCAWPSGSYRDLLMNQYQLDPTNEFSEQNLAIWLLANENVPAGCSPNQFQCSNDICLNEAKLCNFVDDCMEDEFGVEIKGANDMPFGEDELEILCKPVLGRVSFESKDLGIRGLSMLNIPSKSTFWTLNSAGWPQDKIRVRNNFQLATSLPARDHTFKSSHGHYLSLEISPSLVAQSNHQVARDSNELGRHNIQWVYLNSPWMRKLDINGGGSADCRVKFFYNLVTDYKPTADSSPGEYLPFMIYLIIEHFVLEYEPLKPNHVTGVNRHLDTLIFSHSSDLDDLILANRGDSIDYPGLDFWREANYELADLEAGDVFYMRIAVIVELTEPTKMSRVENRIRRATLSIDDLSTHFGCALLDDESLLNKTRKQSLDNSIHLNNYLKSNRLGSIYNSIPRRRRQVETQTVQFEAHKLIICVFGALFSVFGAILAIVYVVVPYVERFAMSYNDRLASGLSDLDSSTRDGSGSCELTTETDWEQLSRLWRRPTLYSSTESASTSEAAVTTLNS